MRIVRLTTRAHDRDHIAFVDDEDYDLISKYKWHVHQNNDFIYARIDRGAQLMHRLLMKPGSAMLVHHRDGNGLNNTRKNMSIVSRGKHRWLHVD